MLVKELDRELEIKILTPKTLPKTIKIVIMMMATKEDTLKNKKKCLPPSRESISPSKLNSKSNIFLKFLTINLKKKNIVKEKNKVTFFQSLTPKVNAFLKLQRSD